MNAFELIRHNTGVIHKAHSITRAIKHGLRQRMIEYIIGKGQATVTEIFIAFRLEQSAASQHLAILRKAGIVKTQRSGKNIYYSIEEARVSEILCALSELNKS